MEKKSNYLSSNIKFLRLRKNITLKQVGDFCGKSDVAVHYWENGLREPNSVDLGKLSNFFNIPVDNLIFTDLRFSENEPDETELLFSKYKDILTDDDKETIKFIIEKRKKDIDKQ